MKKTLILLFSFLFIWTSTFPVKASEIQPIDSTDIIEVFDDSLKVLEGHVVDIDDFVQLEDDSLSSKSATKHNSTATATASFKQYNDSVYLRTITRSVSISCDKNGKLN